MTEPRKVRVVCEKCDSEGHVELSYEMGPNDPPETDCPRCLGACEFEATLIPLSTGPVVVDAGAWEGAKAAIAHIADEANAWEFRDTDDSDVRNVLAAFFPHGIEVAEVVGVVKNEEVTQDNVPIVRLYTTNGRLDITRRTVALLADPGQEEGDAK